jgi:hypothetical protein
MKVRHTAAFAGAILLLAGCTAFGSAAEPRATPGSSGEPSSSSRAPSSGESSSGESSSGASSPGTSTPSAATPTAEPVTAEPVPANPPTDSGPAEYAQGVVTVDDLGVPVEYEVAPDDNAGAICKRLGVRWWQLEDASGERLGTYPMLYAGDVITITTKQGAAHDPSAANALC